MIVRSPILADQNTIAAVETTDPDPIASGSSAIDDADPGGLDVALEVGSDALEPADRDRLGLDAAAPARRFARTIARATEDARKDVRIAIEQVRIGEASL